MSDATNKSWHCVPCAAFESCVVNLLPSSFSFFHIFAFQLNDEQKDRLRKHKRPFTYSINAQVADIKSDVKCTHYCSHSLYFSHQVNRLQNRVPGIHFMNYHCNYICQITIHQGKLIKLFSSYTAGCSQISKPSSLQYFSAKWGEVCGGTQPGLVMT